MILIILLILIQGCNKTCHKPEDFVIRKQVSFKRTLKSNPPMISEISQFPSNKSKNDWIKVEKLIPGKGVKSEYHQYFKPKKKQYGFSREYGIGSYSPPTSETGELELPTNLKAGQELKSDLWKNALGGDGAEIGEACYTAEIEGKTYEGITIISYINKYDGTTLYTTYYSLIGLGINISASEGEDPVPPEKWSATISEIK